MSSLRLTLEEDNTKLVVRGTGLSIIVNEFNDIFAQDFIKQDFDKMIDSIVADSPTSLPPHGTCIIYTVNTITIKYYNDISVEFDTTPELKQDLLELLKVYREYYP